MIIALRFGKILDNQTNRSIYISMIQLYVTLSVYKCSLESIKCKRFCDNYKKKNIQMVYAVVHSYCITGKRHGVPIIAKSCCLSADADIDMFGFDWPVDSLTHRKQPETCTTLSEWYSTSTRSIWCVQIWKPCIIVVSLYYGSETSGSCN